MLNFKDQLVYNIHVLLHLSHDVQRHGCLDSISEFPFENFLHKVNKFVRKLEFPLAQVIRRLSEVDQKPIVKDTGLVCPLKKQHFVSPIPSGLSVKAQYQEMYSEQWAIKVSVGANVFIIGNNVCVIHNIVKCSNGVCCKQSFLKEERILQLPVQLILPKYICNPLGYFMCAQILITLNIYC